MGGGVKGPVGGGVLSAREEEEKVAWERTGRASVGTKVSPGLAMHEARPARTEARADSSASSPDTIQCRKTDLVVG